MTKKIILEKALEMFTGKGYMETSMDDIAKAVGIKKASLYSHYNGKERIFEAIFNDILEEYKVVIHDLTHSEKEGDTISNLKNTFTAFLSYCQGNLKMYFWDRYFYYPPEFFKDVMAEKTLETQVLFIDYIQDLFRKGMVDGQIKKQPLEKPTMAYYYLMIGLSMSVRLYEKEDFQKIVSDALDGFLTGVSL